MYAQAALSPMPAPVPEAADPALKLYDGRSLRADEAEALFARLVRGELAPHDIAAMLVALRLKGESMDELIGAARALAAAAAPFPRPDYPFADTCGTGGDGSGSINVSTAAGFVAAAAGLPVVKHGNRSFTSRCGSADVLERLGARLDAPADVSRRALDQTGFCFLFAPLYHPGLAHAGPVRRALGVRTIMNLLGPCLNPASPPVQLLGVADPALLEPIARTLAALGVEKALVVHGAGLDEIAPHAETRAVRLDGHAIAPLTLAPEDARLPRGTLAAIRGGGPDENAARFTALLGGEAPAEESRVVALNAGALLMTAGRAATFGDGVALAADVLASGRALAVLEAFVEASRG